MFICVKILVNLTQNFNSVGRLSDKKSFFYIYVIQLLDYVENIEGEVPRNTHLTTINPFEKYDDYSL